MSSIPPAERVRPCACGCEVVVFVAVVVDELSLPPPLPPLELVAAEAVRPALGEPREDEVEDEDEPAEAEHDAGGSKPGGKTAVRESGSERDRSVRGGNVRATRAREGMGERFFSCARSRQGGLLEVSVGGTTDRPGRRRRGPRGNPLAAGRSCARARVRRGGHARRLLELLRVERQALS
jgi:hypothetical protein